MADFLPDQMWKLPFTTCNIPLRPLDLPSHQTCVNVPLIQSDMNEVTMRSVLATHSAGMSWRDLHKIATIFDMTIPHQAMPPRYSASLENVTKKAVEPSMSDTVNQLHQKVDCKLYLESNSINVSISLDGIWKTRGFYSNAGFGAAISTSPKKVLNYELLSRLCQMCSMWNEDKQNKCPLKYQNLLRHHKPNCNRNYIGSSQAMETEATEGIWGHSFVKNERATLARATRVVIHSIFVLRPSALGKWESYL